MNADTLKAPAKDEHGNVWLALRAGANDGPTLNLRLSTRGKFVFCALLHCKPMPAPMLAYAAADIEDSRLDETDRNWQLWLGRASFGVTATEAQAIRSMFAPYGLGLTRCMSLGAA